MNHLDKVIAWIEAETNLKYDADWGRDENLLEAGLLDSLKLMRLLVYIEELIGQELDDARISYKDLVSVDRINNWYFNGKG